jgi:hypothetical protein
MKQLSTALRELYRREDLRAYFRDCNARRKRQDACCVVCDKPMPDALTVRRYCSAACSQRAYRQRQRGTSAVGGERA